MNSSALTARLLGVVLMIAALGSWVGANAQTQSAREIMAEVYRQDTSRDATLRATLEISSKNGTTLRKRIVLYRIGSPGDSKTLVYFTDPPEMQGVVLLSINRRGETGRQWIYLPATQRVRPVRPRDRSDSFAGSDFSYEDVAERVLDDFSYRLLKEDDTIEGHRTFKVEATPVAPGLSQYGFIYYWVGQDVPVILHAELYDKQGRLVRRFHARQLKKVSGIWGARHMEMSSARENSRTTFTIGAAHFNTGLTDDLFTPDRLGRTGPLLQKGTGK
jgi:outer membrane lipoprotein-sorting protein